MIETKKLLHCRYFQEEFQKCVRHAVKETEQQVCHTCVNRLMFEGTVKEASILKHQHPRFDNTY